MSSASHSQVCSSIIVQLAEMGSHVYGELPPRPIQLVMRRFTPANEKQLTGIFRGPDGFDTSKSGAYVYAPKVDRGNPGLWPVMAFSASNGFIDFRIRVALFFALNPDIPSRDGSDTQGDNSPRAVAWRFEPPEGDSGAHCYYHAQPISSWNKDASGRLPVATPLNESHPAFPLVAKDSVGLLAAVLVSLYGHEWTKAFLANRSLRRCLDLAKESFSGLNLLDAR
jgi:hypothetical protein